MTCRNPKTAHQMRLQAFKIDMRFTSSDGRNRAISKSGHAKTIIIRPASWLEPFLEGLLGSPGGFGRKFPEGGLNFLEGALVWKFPYRNLPKQSSKMFASEPPKLLRSPSRSGPMRKLVAELSYVTRVAKSVLKILACQGASLIRKMPETPTSTTQRTLPY